MIEESRVGRELINGTEIANNDNCRMKIRHEREKYLILSTTNAIESLNFSLRKIIKNRALFPNDEAVYKILYLALRNIAKKWTMPIPNWSGAMNQFAIIFEGRVPMSGFGTDSFTQII